MNHPIIVYGVKETMFNTILHPGCLKLPLRIHAYEYDRVNNINEVLIPVYGVECNFDSVSGVCFITDVQRQDVQKLYICLKLAGKTVDLGFFPVHKVPMTTRFKTYLLEEEENEK